MSFANMIPDDSGGGGLVVGMDEFEIPGLIPSVSRETISGMVEDNEEVKALAARLAPQVEQLDALLAHHHPIIISSDGSSVHSGTNNSNNRTNQNNNEGMNSLVDNDDHDGDDDDDDDLGAELEQLHISSQLLRQELEFAHDFGSWLSRSAENTPQNHHHDQQSIRFQMDEATVVGGGTPADNTISPNTTTTTTTTITTAQQQQQTKSIAIMPRRELFPLSVELEMDSEGPADDIFPIPTPEPQPPAKETLASSSSTGQSLKAPNNSDNKSVSSSTRKTPPTPRSYSLQDHAKALGISTEPRGGWYLLDVSSYYCCQEEVGNAEHKQQHSQDQLTSKLPDLVDPVVQEYCLSLPVKELQRLYVGASDLFQTSTNHNIVTTNNNTPLRRQSTGSDTNVVVVEDSPILPNASQWTTALPTSTVVALNMTTPNSTNNNNNSSNYTNTPGGTSTKKFMEVLPVRTTAIRIRPDVLCGAVMDALHHALQNLQNADVWKRQGGHIVAIVGGTLLCPSTTPPPKKNNNNNDTAKDCNTTALPPYVIHAQLCTHKSNDSGGRRILLLQTYHVTSAAAASTAANGPADWTIPPTKVISIDHAETAETFDFSNHHSVDYFDKNDDDNPHQNEVDHDDDDETEMERLTTSNHLLQHMKEACALIQRIETSPQKSPFIPKLASSPPTSTSRFSWLGSSAAAASATAPSNMEPLGGVFGSPSAMRQAVSEHLLQHLQPCPSVQDGGLTIPALSKADWPVLMSSSRWIAAAFEELETRDLTYNTLRTSRFGAFPALPTLDVHYCSQMRRLSRERMIRQLLHSASQLEEFARESEYACANLISMLQPMFESYDLEPPALPQPVPLTAYPLDFVAPQAACPPWGYKVMEALNMVSATTSDANTKQQRQTFFSDAPSESDVKQSFQMAQEAVDMVYDAFTKQDDEERSARLGRKNSQVLDRLAKMQGHQQACLFALRDGDSHKALTAANDFFAKAQLANNHLEASPQVPLLKSSIVVGSASSGTCYVTATHILFVTQLIPFLGGTKASLWNLQDVKFRLQDHSNEVLSLLPGRHPVPSIAVIDVQSRRTVLAFRPAVAAARFYRVLEVIRTSALPQVVSQPFGGPMEREGSTSSQGEQE